MKITEVIVSAGRTVSHPLESYSNLRPHLTLKATLDDGDDYQQVARELQAKAEGMIEDHKNSLIKNIIEIDRMEKREREIQQLERGIRNDQSRLDELRSAIPALAPASID